MSFSNLLPLHGPAQLPEANLQFARSLEILVLQPTPFCNLDCDYCYLSQRDVIGRMSIETIRDAVRLVIDGGLVEDHLSVVWHAGEPLVLSTDYYSEAFAAIENVVQQKFRVSHSFQTNGTRIDDNWCEFLKRHDTRIGLSIDGPAFLHDLHRKTRQGKPTHALTMLGVQKLREYKIPFHVIAVVSLDSLDHAGAIFRFFEELDVEEIGFNVEELEGDHENSSLTAEGVEARLDNFWQRLYELYESSGRRVRIREFQRATSAILAASEGLSWRDVAAQNDQVLPFRILSVDWQGRISTFSPELLGVCDRNYDDFSFGRVGRDSLVSIQTSPTLQRVAREVSIGVHECSRSCEYFSVCGGGSPSNKYFENGSFMSTTTMYCRSSIQLPIKTVLSGLERQLQLDRPYTSGIFGRFSVFRRTPPGRSHRILPDQS
jgi:uncharacterized protein